MHVMQIKTIIHLNLSSSSGSYTIRRISPTTKPALPAVSLVHAHAAKQWRRNYFQATQLVPERFSLFTSSIYSGHYFDLVM